MDKTQKNPVQSVLRAVDILNCFEKHTELRITEISKMVDLHKSTASGLIYTLEMCGFLEQNKQNSKYRLGIGIYRLGLNYQNDLRTIAQPYLHQLVEKFKETANLVLLQDDNVLYIEKIESPHSMRICTKSGQSIPAHQTAVGKAILAKLPNDALQSLLERASFEKVTEHTLTSKEAVMQQIRQIRHCGYARDDEELEYGLTCIGAAVVDSRNEPIGGISVSGPTSRMDEKQLNEIIPTLIEYAKIISSKL